MKDNNKSNTKEKEGRDKGEGKGQYTRDRRDKEWKVGTALSDYRLSLAVPGQLFLLHGFMSSAGGPKRRLGPGSDLHVVPVLTGPATERDLLLGQPRIT